MNDCSHLHLRKEHRHLHHRRRERDASYSLGSFDSLSGSHRSCFSNPIVVSARSKIHLGQNLFDIIIVDTIIAAACIVDQRLQLLLKRFRCYSILAMRSLNEFQSKYTCSLMGPLCCVVDNVSENKNTFVFGWLVDRFVCSFREGDLLVACLGWLVRSLNQSMFNQLIEWAKRKNHSTD